jgi:hypothetical protein
MLEKDYVITPEDVQNHRTLHETMVQLAEAIKELQEQMPNAKPEKPEKVKGHGTANTGKPTAAGSTD